LIVQVAQLRDAASKKDAEIERLQALKDRGTLGESNLGNDKFKFKPFSASPHGRRMSTEPAVQRNHKLTMDTGGVVNEVCSVAGTWTCGYGLVNLLLSWRYLLEFRVPHKVNYVISITIQKLPKLDVHCAAHVKICLTAGSPIYE
jgi:hypothetical protein